jgi:DNA-binding IclR family transcriptional regulator
MTDAIQSVSRAAEVLRAVGGLDDGRGARIVDVVTRTGLSKSTTYRLLVALCQTGLVEQDEHSGYFHLGLDVVALGARASRRFGLAGLAAEATARLAERTRDTVYLSVRSGFDAVCLDRVVGTYPIKVLTLDVGDRRPLGIGAGSLAILAALEDDEIRDVLDINAKRLDSYPNLDRVTLLHLVETTRREGYALNPGLVIPEMSAVGVPVRDGAGHPIAALSIAALTSRLSGERLKTVAAWLDEERVLLELQLARSSPG